MDEENVTERPELVDVFMNIDELAWMIADLLAKGASLSEVDASVRTKFGEEVADEVKKQLNFGKELGIL